MPLIYLCEKCEEPYNREYLEDGLCPMCRFVIARQNFIKAVSVELVPALDKAATAINRLVSLFDRGRGG